MLQNSLTQLITETKSIADDFGIKNKRIIPTFSDIRCT